MPLRSAADPRWPMHTAELKRLLGLPPKLPAWGRMHDVWCRQGYFIRLLPQGPTLTYDHPWRGPVPRRRMAHRLQVQCNGCRRWIPAGRLAQHERACPACCP